MEDTLSRLEARLLGLEDHCTLDRMVNSAYQHRGQVYRSTSELGLSSKVLSLWYRSSQPDSACMLLSAIPSRDCDVESATGNLIEGLHDIPAPNVLDIDVRVQDIRGCGDDSKMIDNQLFACQIADRLENDSPTSPVSDSAWNIRALESLTMYGELAAARSPEEFAPVHLKFQREWTFNGGFVSWFTVTFCFWLSANFSFDI